MGEWQYEMWRARPGTTTALAAQWLELMTRS